MKKLILTAFAVTCAVSVFAQGTVNFQSRIANVLVTHVYVGGDQQYWGNGPTDLPAGTTTWGANFTLASGGSYLCALMSAPGTADPKGNFANLVAPFRTGAGAGFISGGQATLANVAKDAPSATLQLFAWDNSSGAFGTVQAAWTAYNNARSSITAGVSSPFVVNGIGGDLNVPPNLLGLTSFNIWTPVPEPSTLALAGLGAAMLIFRRRK